MIRERNGIKELEIFWSFEKDNNLSKFKRNASLYSGTDGNTFVTFTSGGVPMQGEWSDDKSEDTRNYWRMNFIKRFFLYLYNKFVLPQKIKRKNDRKITTILNFFTSLSSSFNELTPIGEIAETYKKALEHSMITGQVSLQEKIKTIIDVARTEAFLIENKLTKYVVEDQIIDFYESTERDKNLKLTWIKNFAKVIPSDLVELKKKLDDQELFDNYVVLHYDPKNDATVLTKKEKEAKKDPILFGVLENSKKLYYIGDWKDEYCDLTLEDMFTKLGEEVLSINNASVKTYINSAGTHKVNRQKRDNKE